MSANPTPNQSTATPDQPWTIKRLLDWTTDFFQSKGLESARLSAEILLAEAMKCPRIQLYTQFDRVPEEGILASYRDWVKRHAKGEPVAYLVGHKEFFSLKFNVDSNVLIPRPETEHVILATIEAAKQIHDDSSGPIQIVDVGSGSGCIAITLAKHIENASIAALEISTDAIEIARQNIELHNVADTVTLIESDLFANLPTEFKPNIIVSNPPYIGRAEIDTVDESVKAYEPDIALFAGDDGLAVIRRLVADAADLLTTGGYLIFETSPIVFDACLQIVTQSGAFGEPESIKDYSGHRRVIQTIRN
jgi:release factor glutamine methyltransferase